MRVFFIGDSLTLGYLDPTMRGWPGRVAEKLIAEGLLDSEATLCNLGVRGNAAAKMVERWESEVSVRLADDPALFLFCFGTADSTQQFPPEQSMAAARSMLSGAKKMGKVLFLTPPPVTDEKVTARVGLLAEQLTELCAELDVPCLDLFSRLSESGPYMKSLTHSDNIHPDPMGYDLMATIILGWDGLKNAIRP